MGLSGPGAIDVWRLRRIFGEAALAAGDFDRIGWEVLLAKFIAEASRDEQLALVKDGNEMLVQVLEGILAETRGYVALDASK